MPFTSGCSPARPTKLAVICYAQIRTHPVLLGECLGGAMYERDFVKVCQEAGFAAPLRLTSRAFAVSGCRRVQRWSLLVLALKH